MNSWFRFFDVTNRLLNFHSILGKSRSVSLADKQNLPFCEAFLWEVQRMSCVAPAGLEHRATESIPFHGFIIPKGTAKDFLVGPFEVKKPKMTFQTYLVCLKFK